MVHQLFLQHSTRLNEQAAVNGLVGHAHALVVGITGLQPSGNLLRRPVQNQFTRNDVAQLTVYGKQTAFRPQRCVPCLLVRIIGAIGRSATMARNLPAHRRRSPMKTTGDLTNRRTGSHPSRNVLSLSERERQPRAATSHRRDAAARQQHSANRVVTLAVDAPDFMQRLPGLPSTPNVTLINRRKPKPSWSHSNTTFPTQIYIRWCCIDLSNAPRKVGAGIIRIPIPFRIAPQSCKKRRGSGQLRSLLLALRPVDGSEGIE